jgi:hypothetical protein
MWIWRWLFFICPCLKNMQGSHVDLGSLYFELKCFLLQHIFNKTIFFGKWFQLKTFFSVFESLGKYDGKGNGDSIDEGSSGGTVRVHARRSSTVSWEWETQTQKMVYENKNEIILRKLKEDFMVNRKCF